MIVASAFLLTGTVGTSPAAATSTTAQQLHAIERELGRHEAQIARDHEAATQDDRALEARVTKLEARKTTPTFWLGLVSGAVLALVGQLVKWIYDAFVDRRRDGMLIDAAQEQLQETKGRVAFNRTTLAGEPIVPLLPLALPGVASLWRAPPKAIRDTSNAMSEIGTLLAAVEHANDLSARRDVVAFADKENAPRLDALDSIVDQQLAGVDEKIDGLLGVWP
jgi:outer membrane murein-binding lipoprotein Lpp